MRQYRHQEIEEKWRLAWEATDLYKTVLNQNKDKKYVLDFFPYPSGSGLHVGHCRNYTISDVIPRYYRMKGYSVMHPMGWDAFGLPAENFALKTGTPPRISTDQNIANFKRQLRLLGTSYDWSREIDSSKPDFYKFTQYFFLLLFKNNLAYKKESAQWWCDSCKTVLANEQVEGGKCWRCSNLVSKKMLNQWFFKITDYADRLLDDLDTVDWPENIKTMQRNWIGKSFGAEVDFGLVDNPEDKITVFTTRIDTIFGATFLVLAPEYQELSKLVTVEQKKEVDEYLEKSKQKSELERIDNKREKTGVFTGSYAFNPATGEEIQIWVADYVLSGYGTGAIMAVPAEDERDEAFADAHNLDVINIYENDRLVNSGKFNGLSKQEAISSILEQLSLNSVAESKVNYKLRDWLISRQRYWGCPIPIINCSKCGLVPVPEKDLPVVLPEISDYTPKGDGSSPLAKIKSFVEATCPECSGPATRETDTMDGFACSSWYYLRFLDPKNKERFASKEAIEYWMPVDIYIGGAEHAVMHLLYARFWYKVMFDNNLVNSTEPFSTLKNQGMVLAEGGEKMSKSKNNVINPDTVINEYGADTLRLYELFLGPFDDAVAWNTEAIDGCRRFLNRFYRILPNDYIEKEISSSVEVEIVSEIMLTIEKVEKDILDFKFNTAIAAMMEFINKLTQVFNKGNITKDKYTEVYYKFNLILSPFAPFITEEINELLGNVESVHLSTWPVVDQNLINKDFNKMAVQVNGKFKSELLVGNVDEEECIEMALDLLKIDKDSIKKTIFVKDKIINFVI